eukprot:CAMPEP_0113823444 /NCGR_PEP_ID=MMETSP0328-20130328/2745_1 /TAXON_ID=39455 /ORGANISM="Alexandrium minutum" /LENGTH=272 /DNA_ID=CAMNT_0000791383 /DNA_START=347 /DNA_END=1162 /DNA_ORIENTATION=- /assembly_acc=CAM_ASM_000350
MIRVQRCAATVVQYLHEHELQELGDVREVRGVRAPRLGGGRLHDDLGHSPGAASVEVAYDGHGLLANSGHVAVGLDDPSGPAAYAREILRQQHLAAYVVQEEVIQPLVHEGAVEVVPALPVQRVDRVREVRHHVLQQAHRALNHLRERVDKLGHTEGRPASTCLDQPDVLERHDVSLVDIHQVGRPFPTRDRLDAADPLRVADGHLVVDELRGSPGLPHAQDLLQAASVRRHRREAVDLRSDEVVHPRRSGLAPPRAKPRTRGAPRCSCTDR